MVLVPVRRMPHRTSLTIAGVSVDVKLMRQNLRQALCDAGKLEWPRALTVVGMDAFIGPCTADLVARIEIVIDLRR